MNHAMGYHTMWHAATTITGSDAKKTKFIQKRLDNIVKRENSFVGGIFRDFK
jgi:hypothetical protein